MLLFISYFDIQYYMENHSYEFHMKSTLIAIFFSGSGLSTDRRRLHHLYRKTILFSLPVVMLSLLSVLIVGQHNALAQNTQISQSVANSTGPATAKLSDKGNYKVEIKWGSGNSSNFLSGRGFDMEISFLNASAPEATQQSIPQKETNLTSQSSINPNGANVPSIIERVLPVESFDIAVYSDHGKILWQKTNQPVTGGRALESIKLENGYSGAITIQITNIKNGGNMGNTIAGPLSGSSSNITTSKKADNNTDSVTFTAKVGA